MKEKLVVLLDQQIAGVLPKIIEGGDDEDEEETEMEQLPDEFSDDVNKEQRAHSPIISIPDKDVSNMSPLQTTPRQNDYFIDDKQSSKQEIISQHDANSHTESGGGQNQDHKIKEEYILPNHSDANPTQGNQDINSIQEDSDQPELNEELYDKLMMSINEMWPAFNIEEGTINLDGFKQIMTKVAEHQGLYEGTEEEVNSATIFFTDENLENIYRQILEHESTEREEEPEETLITHSSVVDILYNVLN